MLRRGNWRVRGRAGNPSIMSRCGRFFALAVLVMAACNEDPREASDDWAPEGTWIETWRDDFEGPSASAPNPANWFIETNPSPPNGELEYYTDRRENSFVDGEGHLILRALKESYLGKSYTSGRVNTGGRVMMTYGRIEARIKLPAGKGLWPAFWMLGVNGNWPACGEIDIMELAGSRPSVVQGSLHGPDFFGTSSLSRFYGLESGTFADDFHIFAVEWAPDGIRWLVDESVYQVRTRDSIVGAGKQWVFNLPFFIIVNLAIGGNYDGSPDASTIFPSQVAVDYVKVSRLEPP